MSAIATAIRAARRQAVPTAIREAGYAYYTRTAEQRRADLLADTLSDLTRAVIRGEWIDYGDGFTPELASEAVDSAALGVARLDEMRAAAWQAAANGADAGDLFTAYVHAAVVHYAEILVDMMLDGRRITFGAKR